MRICSGAGCLRKVAEDVRFCDECRTDKSTPQARTGWQRAQSDAMLLEYKGKRWLRGIRPRALQRYPFCVDCKRKPSQVADHDIPARIVIAECRALGLFPYQKYPGFYILDNIRGRCHSCHNRKTRIEDSQDWRDALAALLAPYIRDKRNKGENTPDGGG